MQLDCKRRERACGGRERNWLLLFELRFFQEVDVPVVFGLQVYT